MSTPTATNAPRRSLAPSPAWRDRLLALFGRRGWRGFTRLHAWLKPAGARRELRYTTRYGSEFLLVPGDGVDRHVVEEGFYESEVLEAIRPFLSDGAVLWVVGANFGLHAVTAKFLHPTARVIAFEPFPAIAARLLENSRLNAAPVELHAYALSAAGGALPFFANTSGNPGMSTLNPVSSFSYDEHFVVATHSGADVIERGFAPAPTAMIVDAEGAEPEVLRGFRQHLASPALKVVVLETANDFLTTHEPADLYGMLRDAGFTIRLLERREHTAHNLSNFAAVRA